MAKTELPKDAKGREIPLNVDALYDKSGERLPIYAWEYMPQLKYSRWRVRFLFDDSGCKYYPDEYYLAPPDSWEQLEEDLDKCVAENNACMYCSADGTCRNCAIRGTSGACTPKMLRDILDRIRKLRGEGE